MNKVPNLFLAVLLSLAFCATSGRAESPYRVPVHFAYTSDAGGGNSWFVVGSHPDVGSWNPLQGVKMAWHDGNVWTADVGIQAGTRLEYKFVKRSTAADRIGDGNNAEWMEGDNLVLEVPAEPPAPVPGKRVVFLCDWPEPVVMWYSMLTAPDYEATNGWQDVTMTKTGPGRYEVDGVGEAGEWMRFSFTQTTEGWKYTFCGTEEEFWTPLDAFCIRDGQVFNYEPQGSLSDSYIESRFVDSFDRSIITGRWVQIYLPRGYNEQTNRRYPVVYFADGQNVFDENAAYGGWKAGATADREIRAGRMREAILVGIPCRTEPIPGDSNPFYGRLWEYLPHMDCLKGTDIQGLGGYYAKFLVDNVKPTLDYNFRTLGGYADTAHIGSSAGGLLSIYLGTCTNVFGLIGALSGVYNETYCPEFRRVWREDHLRSGKKVWLDTGTEETNIEGENLYESNFEAYDQLLASGHVPNRDLRTAIGVGNPDGQHHEGAWAKRLPYVFRFLLDVRDETNPLLLRPWAIGNDGLTMQIPGYPGFTYTVKRADSATNLLNQSASTTVCTTNIVDRPWGVATYPATDAGFYWVEAK